VKRLSGDRCEVMGSIPREAVDFSSSDFSFPSSSHLVSMQACATWRRSSVYYYVACISFIIYSSPWCHHLGSERASCSTPSVVVVFRPVLLSGWKEYQLSLLEVETISLWRNAQRAHRWWSPSRVKRLSGDRCEVVGSIPREAVDFSSSDFPCPSSSHLVSMHACATWRRSSVY